MSAITIVYRVIAAGAVVLVVLELFKARGLKDKLNAALVLVPLVLRALMVA